MIASQKPSASYVGLRTWNEFGRFVKKGEKGVMILAPIVRRKTDGVAEPEETSRPILGFRAAHVFDISQTDGKELPQIGVDGGDPPDCGDKLRRFCFRAGHLGRIFQGNRASPRNVLRRADQFLPAQAPAEEFSTLAHELAHELLHRRDRRSSTTKRVREAEDEATTFVVCQSVGLETRSAASD